MNEFIILFRETLEAALIVGIIYLFLTSNNASTQKLWLAVLTAIIASVIVAYYSRKREFSADAGAARLVGADKMRSALERLKQNHPSQLEGSMMAFGIASGKGVAELFSSHPPLDERINALR